LSSISLVSGQYKDLKDAARGVGKEERLCLFGLIRLCRVGEASGPDIRTTATPLTAIEPELKAYMVSLTEFPMDSNRFICRDNFREVPTAASNLVRVDPRHNIAEEDANRSQLTKKLKPLLTNTPRYIQSQRQSCSLF
jgi:hypothetical protein